MNVDIEYDEDNDCYAILDLRPDCDEMKLKRVHKRMILHFHPDKQPFHARKEAHEPFVRMQNAFEMLNDATTRRNYDLMREYFFQKAFKRRRSLHISDYNVWKAMREESIRCKEAERKALYDKKRAQWRKEAQAHEQEAKRRQEDEEKEQKQRQEQQKQRDEKERTTQRKSEEEIRILLEEKASMERDYRLWETKQREERTLEVDEREARQRKLRDKQKQDQKDFEQTQKNRCKAFLSKQELEFATEIERQEKERESQRHKRKLVREEYDTWQNQVTQDIENAKRGLPNRHKRKRPSFYSPKFGFTKSGQPCQQCKQACGFCWRHRDQDN